MTSGWMRRRATDGGEAGPSGKEIAIGKETETAGSEEVDRAEEEPMARDGGEAEVRSAASFVSSKRGLG